MEHITDINKQAYIEDCKTIVSESIKLEKIELSDRELTLLTEEIMDTSLMMGGDYSKENIRAVTIQYILSDFLPRFKKAHR
ncbi:MAG: hypothetical protein U0L85_01075 [Bacilli bacterium]|nr:hypothetical protein [Bacilli bacterium]